MNLLFQILATLLLVLECGVCIMLCSTSISGAQGETDKKAFAVFVTLAFVDLAAIYSVWAIRTANPAAAGFIVFIVVLAFGGYMYNRLIRS